ncbi:glycosyltransferase [Geminocystis sp. NIES-3709]|uniref:glycosyltransferase n=1 Tax=Geminocystis sp. NIES-3709 TaxID=1617448 RepID=UPI0005FCCC05|nr:glycosyltransferase [Geminocystis sp. NIES-3709]BAQ65878.1 glycosyl transferase group 1 [Geminocystis sp. NIES-3709]
MKNILVVSHSDFPMNSAVHVHHFANELIKLGLDCVVAVPLNQNSVSSLKDNLYKVTCYSDIDNLCSYFSNNQPPDIVHCWTPREHIRLYCYHLSQFYEFNLVIHLEDSEESIIERFFKIPIKNWTSENDRILPYNLSHPRKYREFLSTADGVTVIIDKLQEFIPVSIPTITLYPGVDTQEFFPRQKNISLLKELEIPENTTILVYTGIVHPTNLEEVRSLYLAIGKLNLAGKPTVLIRTGVDNNLPLLEDNEVWIKEYIIELGWVERQKIPDILALADVLIQPGKSDDFNDYRFPSKIPEFLAMGKPIILPETNIGKVLTHKENAFILPKVDENSLPSAIDLLMNDLKLAEKLSIEGIKFTHNYLNWQKNTKNLYHFYQTLYSQKKLLSFKKNISKRLEYYQQDLNNNSWNNLQLLLLKESCKKNQINIKYLEEVNQNNALKINNLENEKKYLQQELNNKNNQLISKDENLFDLQNIVQKSSIELQELEQIKNKDIISLQQKLEKSTIELQELEQVNYLLMEEIKAMKSSKFWQIRNKWFIFKRFLGLGNS